MRQCLVDVRQGAEPITSRLQVLMKEAGADSAKHAEYMEDVQRLAGEVHSILQAMHNNSSIGDGRASEASKGQQDEL